MPCPYFKKGQNFCRLVDGQDWKDKGKEELYRWHIEHGYCEDEMKHECCSQYIARERLLKTPRVWSVS